MKNNVNPIYDNPLIVDTYDNKATHQNHIVFFERTWANSALILFDLRFRL